MDAELKELPELLASSEEAYKLQNALHRIANRVWPDDSFEGEVIFIISKEKPDMTPRVTLTARVGDVALYKLLGAVHSTALEVLKDKAYQGQLTLTIYKCKCGLPAVRMFDCSGLGPIDMEHDWCSF
jgi:hypothetical protein